MYQLSSSPVKEITFGQASKISLNHYYDLLKENVGGLEADEYLQLKLAADIVDLSDDKPSSDGGYHWFSIYNLLKRSDISIEPSPISGGIQTGLDELAQVYARFLRRLRQYVTREVLSDEDQLRLLELDSMLDTYKGKARELSKLDDIDWRRYAEIRGYDIGDLSAYIQWSGQFGYIREIQDIQNKIRNSIFDKQTILNREYPTPEDREIVDAEFNFENPRMRVRYPTSPDYEYGSGDSFNLEYLATLPYGSTALFDDRRAVNWNMTLPTIKSTKGGAISASYDRNTSESKSIETDWKTSASGGWGPFRAKASASEHKKISEDFKQGTEIKLHSESAFKLGIEFNDWFTPTLFTHRHVKDNIQDFLEFFGPNGSLLYYPTQLILVRGFSISFKSSQKWTYDYSRKFSASGGGGFSAFGYKFGGSSSYSKNVKEHKVDKSDTHLKISDDENTIRFVGYTVKKVKVFDENFTSKLANV